ncbi:diguanylate phosphodiesterase [Pseudomonas hunanensis]|nr:diguanylate phosphodiesterase [Pseudomonas hunanensis]
MAPALPVFAGLPADTVGCVQPSMCVHHQSVCRSGFTREYGGGCDGRRRVEIGQQGRPLRG